MEAAILDDESVIRLKGGWALTATRDYFAGKISYEVYLDTCKKIVGVTEENEQEVLELLKSGACFEDLIRRDLQRSRT